MNLTIDIPDDSAARFRKAAQGRGLTVDRWMLEIAEQEARTAAVDVLPHRESGFDAAKAQAAGARIRELRRGVRLDRRGQSIRELAHIGHKY